MSSHLSLEPADLDRLEDALEDLELEGLGDDRDGLGDLDDPVAKRLAEFREILQLSREALPIEEVPAGLLDEVMAEARRAGAAATPAASEPGSFWSRWRLSVWVPTLAFAGSAALLLMVLVPKSADEPAAVAQKDDAKVQANDEPQKPADGRLAKADLERLETEADGVARGQGLVIGERAPDPAAAAEPMPVEEAEPEPEEELPPEPAMDADDDEAASTPKSKRRKSASGSSSSAGAMPKPSPAPSVPAPKAPSSAGGKGGLPGSNGDDAKKEDKKDASDPWSELSRADADRRGGNCGLAKMRYEKVRKVDDAKARARALAGLGLCAAESGSMSTAKKLFAQARDADPGVSGFIDRELATIDEAPANADEASQVQSYD